jgi:hypothetical protein
MVGFQGCGHLVQGGEAKHDDGGAAVSAFFSLQTSG